MNGKCWTKDHTKLMILLNDAGCSDHVIAGATGHDVETVGRHRRSLGLPAQHRSAYSTWRAIPDAGLRAIAEACQAA